MILFYNIIQVWGRLFIKWLIKGSVLRIFVNCTLIFYKSVILETSERSINFENGDTCRAFPETGIPRDIALYYSVIWSRSCDSMWESNYFTAGKGADFKLLTHTKMPTFESTEYEIFISSFFLLGAVPSCFCFIFVRKLINAGLLPSRIVFTFIHHEDKLVYRCIYINWNGWELCDKLSHSK